MLVEGAIGNVFAHDCGMGILPMHSRLEPQAHGQDAHPTGIDWLDLTWRQSQQRALRLKSRSGQSIKILLRLGETLRHGDVLLQSQAGSMVAVNILLSEVLLVHPRNPLELARITYELGSLHAPVQFAEDGLLTIDDGPVQAALDKLGLQFEASCRRFEPTLLGTEPVQLASNFAISRRS